MARLSYLEFHKMKDYIICITAHNNDLEIYVENEYFYKNRNSEEIKYRKLKDKSTEKYLIKKTELISGRVIIKTYLKSRRKIKDER